jgi:hypothetical protein
MIDEVYLCTTCRVLIVASQRIWKSLEHDDQISGKDQPFDQDVSGFWFWFLLEKRPTTFIIQKQGQGNRG